MANWHLSQILHFGLLFQVEFERVVNGLGGQKSSQGLTLIWSNGIQCKNRKIFYQRVTGPKKIYFLGPKHESAI